MANFTYVNRAPDDDGIILLEASPNDVSEGVLDISADRTYKLIYKENGITIDNVNGDEEFFFTEEEYDNIPNPEAREGYTANFTLYGMSVYKAINSDIIEVNVSYTAVGATTHTVTFIADDETVGQVIFAEGDTSITEPPVPSKQGYTGRWENYTLGTTDLTVNAIYELITYTVTYLDIRTSAVIATSEFTIETESIDTPETLDKVGYDYYLVSQPVIEARDQTIYVRYAAKTYTVTYVDSVSGEEITSVDFTIEYTSIEEPDLSRAGYEFTLSGTPVITTENQTIIVTYTRVPFKATFKVNGTQVAIINFDENDTEIAPPQIPNSLIPEGYTASWPAITLENNDIEINAILTPIEYTITFKAKFGSETQVIGTVTYTVLTALNSIVYPQAPQHEGYQVMWPVLALRPLRNFDFIATYIPNTTNNGNENAFFYKIGIWF